MNMDGIIRCQVSIGSNWEVIPGEFSSFVLTPLRIDVMLRRDHGKFHNSKIISDASRGPLITPKLSVIYSSPTLALSFPVEVRLLWPLPKTAPYRSAP